MSVRQLNKDKIVTGFDGSVEAGDFGGKRRGKNIGSISKTVIPFDMFIISDKYEHVSVKI